MTTRTPQRPAARPPRDPHPRARAITLCAAALLLALASCRKPPPEPNLVSTTTERGPYRLTITAEPPEVLIGDDVTVTVTLSVPPDADVTLPDAAELGSLDATIAADPPPLTTDDGVTFRRTYRFAPLISGTVEIPELRVRYTTRRTDDGVAGPGHDLFSEPLRIVARSVLTASDDPAHPRDITGALVPPEPPVRRSPWFWAAVIATPLAAGLLCALAAWLLLRWWRRPAPPIAPETWALAAIDALPLPADGDRDAARGFYYRLTEIVRLFIEKRFAVAAPEMTTGEFLTAVARAPSTVPFESAALAELLYESDFVKYAAALPTRGDAEHARTTARAFVCDAAAGARREATAATRAARGELEGAA